MERPKALYAPIDETVSAGSGPLAPFAATAGRAGRAARASACATTGSAVAAGERGDTIKRAESREPALYTGAVS